MIFYAIIVEDAYSDTSVKSFTNTTDVLRFVTSTMQDYKQHIKGIYYVHPSQSLVKNLEVKLVNFKPTLVEVGKDE